MDNIDILRAIIEAEKDAQMTADEAAAQKDQLNHKLAEDKAALHEGFMERARKRVAIIAEDEQCLADEAMARLDDTLTQSMNALRQRYDAEKDIWAETLFAFVLGA